jgi:hypothetical protein
MNLRRNGFGAALDFNAGLNFFFLGAGMLGLIK